MIRINTHPDHPTRVGSWRPLAPNLLTVARLILGVVFPTLPVEWRLSAFLIATFTEAVDGSLARWLHATSTFGRILDPIADKVFVIAVLLTLAAEGSLAWWMLPLIAARDLIVLGGAVWVGFRQGADGLRRMPPSLLGKLATAAQFLLLLVLLSQPAAEGRWTAPTIPMVALTAGLSLVAGVDYLRRFDPSTPR